MRAGSILAILVFIAVAVGHFWRLLNEVSLMVGDWIVPQWVSIVGVIVPAAIAWLLWKESR